MRSTNKKLEEESTWIYSLQLVLLLSFTCFALGVIIWIVRLIYVSWDLKDTFSGSIGIAIVAGVVFSILLSVFHYLFWGIRAGAKEHHSSD